MALKIRLSRGGAKKKPFYRIVVAETTSPRDGNLLKKLVLIIQWQIMIIKKDQ